eukprot:UN34854
MQNKWSNKSSTTFKSNAIDSPLDLEMTCLSSFNNMKSSTMEILEEVNSAKGEKIPIGKILTDKLLSLSELKSVSLADKRLKAADSELNRVEYKREKIAAETHNKRKLIRTMWSPEFAEIYVCDRERLMLNRVQEVLYDKYFMLRPCWRYILYSFIILWLLACDFVIVFYGIQFDRAREYSMTDDVANAYDDAKSECEE